MLFCISSKTAKNSTLAVTQIIIIGKAITFFKGSAKDTFTTFLKDCKVLKRLKTHRTLYMIWIIHDPIHDFLTSK